MDRIDGQYDPASGKTVSFATVATGEEIRKKYYAALAEIDYDEVKTTKELRVAYVKYHNFGAGVGGGFENTNELKQMKYLTAINGPDGKE